MKKIFSLLLISLSLSSCDDRDSVLDDLNSVPTLQFSNNENLFEDSIKTTLKSSKRISNFGLMVSDKESNIKSFTYNIYQGEGKILINNQDPSTLTLTKDNDLNVSYEPKAIGEHRVSFNVIDAFGKNSSGTAIIIAFSNLGPKASYKLNPVKILDPLEYELDASESFDLDQKFGGNIINYTWMINERKIETAKSKIKYIFSSIGNYEIKLTVKDNDGSTSEYTNLISIQ